MGNRYRFQSKRAITAVVPGTITVALPSLTRPKGVQVPRHGASLVVTTPARVAVILAASPGLSPANVIELTLVSRLRRLKALETPVFKDGSQIKDFPLPFRDT